MSSLLAGWVEDAGASPALPLPPSLAKELYTNTREGSRVFVYNFPTMQKFIFSLVLFLGAAFVYLSFSELQSIVHTLQQGNFWLILLAIFVQFISFFIAGLI